MRAGKGKLWRAVCLICIFLFLGGCEKEVSPAKKPSPIRSIQTLQFEVDASLEQKFLDQARLFAKDVERISRGRLMVSVIEKKREVLSESEYDFAYLQNQQLAQFAPSLKTLSLPFLYNDMKHLSLALNSPDIRQLLEERLKNHVFPLAALSRGDGLFLCMDAPEGDSINSNRLMPPYFQGLTIAVHEGNSENIPVFQALGIYAVPFSDEDLLSILNQYVVLDNVTHFINGAEATKEEILKKSEFPDPVYAIETWHNLSPVWFVAQSKTWENLSSWEQAVIQEATAYMIARLEESSNRYQSVWEREAEKREIHLVQMERQALAVTIYDASNGSSHFLLPEYFDKRLFDLIQNYS